MTKALETIAKLNPMINLHKAHIMQVTAILVGGESHCGELGDVVSAAQDIVFSGRTEVRDYEQGWVDRMIRAAKAA